MTTKIDIPPLSGTLDAPGITAWLATCEDTFEAWDLLNPTRTLELSLRILLAGLKLESPVAAHWWCENREVLKKSASWADFVTAVKDRFVPASWRLDALACFYAVSQGSSTFLDFLARLQTARSALSGAGRGFTINDSIMKNHLLFKSNRLLCLRICAIPTLEYTNVKVDGLISLMSSTWNSMVAEGIMSAHAAPQSTATPVLSKFLSGAEHDRLRSAGGCFHCQKTPSSPGWVSHSSRNCPGDKSRGILPRTALASTSINAVSTVTAPNTNEYLDEDSDHHINTAVAAILPSCVLGNGTDSEEDWDDDV